MSEETRIHVQGILQCTWMNRQHHSLSIRIGDRSQRFQHTSENIRMIRVVIAMECHEMEGSLPDVEAIKDIAALLSNRREMEGVVVHYITTMDYTRGIEGIW